MKQLTIYKFLSKYNSLKIIGIFFIALFSVSKPVKGQEKKAIDIYKDAIAALEESNYVLAANHFDKLIESRGYDLLSNTLYNGACIYALNNENEKAFKILNHLATEAFYDNYDHISSDTDLKHLHGSENWKNLLVQIAENEKTKPMRRRAYIEEAILQAKNILEKDNGNLWGANIWSDALLILDEDYSAYSFDTLKNSQTTNNILHKAKFQPNTLSFTNTRQLFQGKRYATVLYDYLEDEGETIIHELFHIYHLKQIDLNGDPIPYLDTYEGRLLLRTEYQALRNALAAAKKNSRKVAFQFLRDAIYFRSKRQSLNNELKKELEIETLEGLAQYTGYQLGPRKDKFQLAIDELTFWESSDTYTRNFPYATGPAYGFLFDYLVISWRSNLDHLYDFKQIAMNTIFTNQPNITKAYEIEAKRRNNFNTIESEELEKKRKQDQLITFYSELFYKSPVVKVKLEKGYAASYDMNGTMMLDDDIVYSQISGQGHRAIDFGNFTTVTGKDRLGTGGILYKKQLDEWWFPQPTYIKENVIRGDNYEIQLNSGWQIEKVKNTEDYIIQKKSTQH
ncbi:hypothetical protein ABN763_11840 [Spongiivirga sp. MCCC 1A20706]|uniref:hypothetical protein n=1 Tax=Spongiivirga sp. MCCC 1A20706 TaxID=3160963 RepID=UPI003977947F